MDPDANRESNGDDVARSRRDDIARSRWRVGVTISVVFGVLGVLMSVLPYYLRHTGSPSAAPAPAAVPAPTSDGPTRHGHGRDH